MNAQPQTIPQRVTEAEYLQYCEDHLEERFELIDGEIVAMEGASRNHGIIKSNLIVLMHAHLKNSNCFVFASAWNVRVGQNSYYPDVVVECGTESEYVAEKPLVIVEVLADDTRAIDLTVKVRDYQTIPTLQEYVLIEQDFTHVAVYRKQENWQRTEYICGDDVVGLESLDLSLAMADIYQRVVFQAQRRRFLQR
ncbi:Uma2 family endonuclease [Conchiformibius kuhniae]|uniref:Uma2 family endonuclease n=1 Tax=Conchiformibius kuhniae TaxID=211502 RepID=A0A8T9MZD8_9NEIS|nr:Uma2 family endonuclease [Conchiformibius kuhniae]UOP05153.1 Uma2 family endonuclease [Conchiformibius kuhniae]